MELGKKEIDENCFENIKVIVHLAGAGIAEKPYRKEKKTIVKSRVLTSGFYMSDTETPK